MRKTKETLRLLIEKAVAVFVLVMLLASNAFAYTGEAISNSIKSQSSNQTESQKGESTDQITVDKQFLEFYSVGETKQIKASHEGEGTLAYKSQNADVASVDQNGTVTWVSGTGPVIITVYIKGNEDIKTEVFASFEADADKADAIKPMSEELNTLSDEEETPDSNKEETEEPNENLKTTPMISQGLDFTVVLKQDGTVWTTGNNNYGQLGDGTSTKRYTYGQVKLNTEEYLTDVAQIAAGEGHVIALKKDGSAVIWGRNTHGQLGDNTIVNSLYPKSIETLEDIKLKYVEAGGLGSSAISADGKVYTWGHNDYGQLGLNNVTTPIKIPANPLELGQTSGEMTGIKKISMGVNHTVFLTEEGTVWAVGRNYRGEIGNNTIGISDTAKTLVSIQVKNTAGNDYLTNIADIAVGGYTSGAVGKNGKVYMWGLGTTGSMGQGTAVTSNALPLVVKNKDGSDELTNMKQISINGRSTDASVIALSNEGKVYTWGYNSNGQLGDNTVVQKNLPVEPVKVDGSKYFASAIYVANPNSYTGGFFSTVLTQDGKIHSFGINTNGELGLGNTIQRNTAEEIYPSYIEFDQRNLNINQGEEYTFEVKFEGEFSLSNNEVNNLDLTYSSTNTDVATINSVGKLTALKPGKTTIIAKDSSKGLIAMAKVYVTDNAVTSIAFPQMDGGENHTISLKSDGTVWAYGLNTSGQLGDGSKVNKTHPVQVKGGEQGQEFLQNIVKIATGSNYSLALDKEGYVYAWGINTNGGLGSGSTTIYDTPIKVKGGEQGTEYLKDIIEITSKDLSSYALTKDGEVYSWGLNSEGRLGDNTTTARTTPVKVQGNLTNVIDIKAHSTGLVALKSDSSVWTLGNNTYGQLGDGTTTAKYYPVQVKKTVVANDFLTNVIDIASGHVSTYVVLENGEAYSFGYNHVGQLGTGNTTNQSYPVRVKLNAENNLEDIREIYAGVYHVIAVTNDNKAYSWGYNAQGELGDGTKVNKSYPVEIYASNGTDLMGQMASFGAGRYTSYATMENGISFAWGWNNYGQLGLNDQNRVEDKTLPFAVWSKLDFIDHKIEIMQGDEETVEVYYKEFYKTFLGIPNPDFNAVYSSSNEKILTVDEDGKVTAVGPGSASAIMYDKNLNLETKIRIVVKQNNELTDPMTAGGTEFSVVLKSDGTVWASGLNTNGQLGQGTVVGNKYELVQVKGENGEGFLQNVKKIDAGYYHAIALLEDGTVWTWGHNGQGQLGQGTTAGNVSTPIQVKGGAQGGEFLTDIIDIASGGNFNAVVDKEGNVYTFGENNYYQIGNGGTTNTGTPTKVIGAFNMREVSCGDIFAIALREDGTVWGWGYGAQGCLGDNGAAQRGSAVQVKGVGAVGNLENIDKINAGYRNSYAIAEDGTVYAWGLNSAGSLGDGTTTQRNVPVIVRNSDNTANLSNIAEIRSDWYTTYAIDNEGKLYSWGNNDTGALADGTTTNRSLPVRALDENKNPITDVIAISAATGNRFGVAIKKDGSVWPAGQNTNGKLGLGDTLNRSYFSQVNPTYLETDKKQAIVKKGESVELNANINMGFKATAETKTVGNLTWESTNTNIATVDNNGKVTAKAQGTVTIIVRDLTNNLEARSIITVTNDSENTITEAMVVSGENHTIFLKSDGTVWSSGLNSSNQLGDGTAVQKIAPVQVLAGAQSNEEGAFLKDIVKVEAGTYGNIALDKNGNVWAWGRNNEGQLGQNNTTNQSKPVKVLSGEQSKTEIYLKDIIDISSKYYSSYALTKDGTVYAWGNNATYGGLGDNSTTNRLAPVKVHGNLTNVVQIESNEQGFVALKGDGTVWAAGRNDYGHLGQGTTGNKAYPIQVKADADNFLKDIIYLSGASHSTMAIKKDRTLWAWGYNYVGNLGTGNTTNAFYPVQVKTDVDNTIKNVKHVESGVYHHVIQTMDGKIYTIGYNNAGQLGDNTTANKYYPVEVLNAQGTDKLANNITIQKVQAGRYHSFAIETNGRVFAWGQNANGELAHFAHGVIGNKTLPVPVGTELEYSPSAIDINIGETKATNVVYKQLLDLYPEISVETKLEYTSADEGKLTVDKDGNITGVKSGEVNLIAYDTILNQYAQLKVRVKSSNELTEPMVVHGTSHTVVLKADGTVWAVGLNTTGQIGQGNILGEYHELTRVKGGAQGGEYLKDIVQIAATYESTIALDKDGNIYAWGGNGNGQLGQGNTTTQNLPAKVLGGVQGGTYLENITKIDAGIYYFGALDNNKNLYIFGRSDYYQSCNGAGNKTTPVKVPLENIMDFATGSYTGYALRIDGTVWSWGYNYYGELGINGVTRPANGQYGANAVYQVIGGAQGGTYLQNIVKIHAGHHTAFMEDKDGKIYSWGYNGYYDLNDDSASEKYLPQLFKDPTNRTAAWENIYQMESSWHTGYVIDQEKNLWTWGYNGNGVASVGNTSLQSKPVKAKDINGNEITNARYINIGVGSYKGSVIKEDGSVWTVGLSSNNGIGTGISTDQLYFKEIQPTYLELNERQTYIKKGENLKLSANINMGFKVYNTQLEVGSLTFESTDETVATVDENGKVTGLKEGTTTIIVKDETNNLESRAIITIIGNEENTITEPQVIGGEEHTVFLKADGTVWAVGRNNSGQLGNGDQIDQQYPVQVLAGEQSTQETHLKNIIKIAVGQYHSIALDIDGNVYTWGLASSGQLGDNTVVLKKTPVKVKAGEQGGEYLKDIIDISANHLTTVALSKDGIVWNWGYNGYNGLGDNTATQRNTPVKVQGNLRNIVKVQAQAISNAGLAGDGTVYSWGYNTNGQLGDGTVAQRAYPVEAVVNTNKDKLKDVIDIESGYYATYVVMKDKTVNAFGYNHVGQLGDGTVVNKTVATGVKLNDETPLKVRQMTAGTYHAMAITEDGKIVSWGLNDKGQLGDETLVNTTGTKNYPVFVKDVQGLDLLSEKIDALKLQSGRYHSFAIETNGRVFGWGLNTYAQLGLIDQNKKENKTRPFPVYEELGFTQKRITLAKEDEKQLEVVYEKLFDMYPERKIETDLYYISSNKNIVTVDKNGKVTAVGIGDASITAFDRITGLSAVTKIKVKTNAEFADPMVESGIQFTAVLKADGTVWTVGLNTNGQLGIGTNVGTKYEYVQVKGGQQGGEFLENIVKIAVGSHHVIALDDSGNVWAWGLNTYGQLGQGNAVQTTLPVKVKGGAQGNEYLENIVDIAAGTHDPGNGIYGFSYALDSDGQIYSWGYNGYGGLGDNSTTTRNLPVKAVNGFNMIAIACGDIHMIGLRNDGTVWATGYNVQGALGDATVANKSIMVQVKGGEQGGTNLENISKIYAGYRSSYAIANDGQVYGWGYNYYGELSVNRGLTSYFNTPVKSLVTNEEGQVVPLKDIREIKINWHTTLMIKNDGTVLSTGYNGNGQLGTGDATEKSLVTPVLDNNKKEIKDGIAIGLTEGQYTTSIIKADGTLWTNGYGANGKSGQGNNNNTSLFTQVVPAYLETDKKQAFIKQGDTITLNASINMGFNTLKDVTEVGKLTWESTDTNIATINENGIVTAKKQGNVTIIVKDSKTGLQAMSYLTVIAKDESVITTPDIQAGDAHTLFLKADGTVWASGLNSNGQLGDNSTVNKTHLVQVVGGAQGGEYLQNIVKIAVGSTNNMALDKNGQVYTWGLNSNNQLGDNTTVQRNAPVKVLAGEQSDSQTYLEDIIDIDTKHLTSWALTKDGCVYAWGYNNEGMLGINATGNKAAPVKVLGNLNNVVKISGSGNTGIALRADGKVFGFGYAGHGELGQGNTGNIYYPVAVKTDANTELTNCIDIEAGYHHITAITKDRSLYAWGRNTEGQLGDGTVVAKSYAGKVKLDADNTLKNVKENITTMYGNFATLMDGSIVAWGQNNYGQLGVNNLVNHNLPQYVLNQKGDKKITETLNIGKVFGGKYTGYVMETNGRVYGMGLNTNGQLSLIDQNLLLNKSLPNIVETQIKAKEERMNLQVNEEKQIEVEYKNIFKMFNYINPEFNLKFESSNTSVAKVDENGMVKGIRSGEAFITIYDVKMNISAQMKVIVRSSDGFTEPMVTGGVEHSSILKADGTVWTTGLSTNGVLGNGETTGTRTQFVQVLAGEQAKPVEEGEEQTHIYLKDIVKIDGGEYFTIALDINGNVYTWGINTYGQLGNGTTALSATPVKVKGGAQGNTYLSNITDIGAGRYFSGALSEDGQVWTWGYSGNHELGYGSTTNQPLPVNARVFNIIQLAVGDHSTLALRNDGTVWAWGYNGNGELGINNVTTQAAAQQVLGVGAVGKLENISKVIGGYRSSYAIGKDGTVYAWGLGTSGQLGDNTVAQKNTPIIVKNEAGTGNLNNIKTITSNYTTTYAITNNNELYAWGANNNGQLGVGDKTNRLLPTKVLDNDGKDTMKHVVYASGNHFNYTGLIIKEDGSVYRVGMATNGKLATPINYDVVIPEQISPAYLENDTAYVRMKKGDTKQTNLNLTEELNVYNNPKEMTNVAYYSLDEEIAKVDENGFITAVGKGKTTIIGITLGTSLRIQIPVEVYSDENGTINTPMIVNGDGFTVALKQDGTVWAWGVNTYGVLGQNDTTTRYEPVQVKGLNAEGFLANIVQIQAGNSNVSALSKDGTVYSWGRNEVNRLGEGTTNQSNVPVITIDSNDKPLKDIVKISVNHAHGLALTKDGTVYGWGYNYYGQMGNNNTTNQAKAFVIPGLPYVIDIATNTGSSYMIAGNGKVYAAGFNTSRTISR